MKKIAVLGSKNTFREFLRLVADTTEYERIIFDDSFEGKEFRAVIKLYDWRTSYRDPERVAFFTERRIR